MSNLSQNTDIPDADLQYQAAILPYVSRTFALTIPALPGQLETVVTNAYLLCRIADTIEDDPDLDYGEKKESLERFLATVRGEEDAGNFSASAAARLSPTTPSAELELMQNSHRIVGVTHSFTTAERQILERCVSVMCFDMSEFQRNASLAGLRDVAELDAYCFTVAGCVGQMLVDLFIIQCEELEEQRQELQSLAVSFGQGLQMTNILKDIWTDHERGACWLPRSVFGDDNFSLENLKQNHRNETFQNGLQTLLGIAHGHLENALEFTCRLPAREVGMRRFCLWALGMAVLTLRKIGQNPLFTTSSQVKISRHSVRATLLVSNIMVHSNRGLRWCFRQAARGLPARPQAFHFAHPK